jgi:hypothetical protein
VKKLLAVFLLMLMMATIAWSQRGHGEEQHGAQPQRGGGHEVGNGHIPARGPAPAHNAAPARPAPRSGGASVINPRIRRRRTSTRQTTPGLATNQAGTIHTITWIIPGSMGTFQDRSARSIFSDCTAATESDSNSTDISFRLRRMTMTM